MLYYIDQLCTPYFSIGLVKTESEPLDQLRLSKEFEDNVSCD